jgi:peptide/nickel transport system substrate-binding protein
MNVVQGFTNWVTDGQIMADELKEIGLSVSINPISYGAWFSALQLGGYDTAVAWTNPGPSPFFLFDGLLNSTNTAPPDKTAPSNWEHWSSPMSDGLLKQYASTTNPNVQRQAMYGLEKIMVEQVPANLGEVDLAHASFFDDETDITYLLCYPGLEIIVFHDLPGELCLLAPFLR